jgi:hypothetical protein
MAITVKEYDKQKGNIDFLGFLVKQHHAIRKCSIRNHGQNVILIFWGFVRHVEVQ